MLTDVTADMKVFCEETFELMAPVIVIENADEAFAVASNSRFGLSAGIIPRDFQKGLELAERIESGMVHINDSFLHTWRTISPVLIER